MIVSTVARSAPLRLMHYLNNTKEIVNSEEMTGEVLQLRVGLLWVLHVVHQVPEVALDVP